jgi:cyclase
MLRPRFIPCLLVRDKGLVKTVGFSPSKYIGDPINAVKIFNEKGADELMVLDIDASVIGSSPDFILIKRLAAECRMPLCYGGGIKTVEQARKIIGLGVEKIAISSAALDDPKIIASIANVIGSQSIVVILDIKKTFFGQYSVYTHNGQRKVNLAPVEVAMQVEKMGAGEIVINSIDLDGRMLGYDLKLAMVVRKAVGLPLTFLGGAGSLVDIENLIKACGVVGAAAGSLFLFKGAYRAVLINYPSIEERDVLISRALELHRQIAKN